MWKLWKWWNGGNYVWLMTLMTLTIRFAEVQYASCTSRSFCSSWHRRLHFRHPEQTNSQVQFQSNPVKYSPPHTTKMREQTGEWVDESVNDNRKCGNLRFIHLTPTSTTQQNKKVICKREQLTANKQLKTFLIQCRPFCFVLFCIVVLR